jgi:hypothetical protein
MFRLYLDSVPIGQIGAWPPSEGVCQSSLHQSSVRTDLSRRQHPTGVAIHRAGTLSEGTELRFSNQARCETLGVVD